MLRGVSAVAQQDCPSGLMVSLHLRDTGLILSLAYWVKTGVAAAAA